MLRKALRRMLPDPTKTTQLPMIRWFGPLLENPNLFHINKSSIAKAFFVGIFCAFLPFPGQMLLSAVLALTLRCNLPISMALIWLTNPITIPPVFLFAYGVGIWLMDVPPIDFNIQLNWDWAVAQGEAMWQPLLVGSLVCGLFFGALGYAIIRLMWRWEVIKKWEARKLRRAMAKEQLRVRHQNNRTD